MVAYAAVHAHLSLCCGNENQCRRIIFRFAEMKQDKKKIEQMMKQHEDLTKENAVLEKVS